MEAKPGDKIKVLCEEKEHTGILIDTKKDTTVLKLANGYNIGISNDTIKNIEVIEKGKDIEIKYSAGSGEKQGLPKISVLHTGGTIASKVDYRTGAVYS
ncbi:Glu-tRNA(Gln) amidotransferase GatDE subunit D, partial [Candidatus Woesearchaeota archaeon]|nr:Glu-tRNA(Gln) amidotransferase GatDE subunit D [Candidatus Woesearchaeota archaeon]